MDSFYPDKAFHIFDKLIKQPGCLYQIDTSQPEQIYSRLDRYQDFTGRAFYYWNKGQGLYRTDIPNIYAPNTDSFINAIQHIYLSIHFGIYLFTDIGRALHDPLVIKIIEHMQIKNNSQKKVLIFAEQELELPTHIESYFTSIRHKVANSNSKSMMAAG